MKSHIKTCILALKLTVTLGLMQGQAFAQVSEHHFLPLPQQAKPIPEPAVGYRVQQVGKHAYVVFGGVVQATFVVTSKGVVLIDAPTALAGKLAPAIKSITDKPVTHVILSHDHDDHIGAAKEFPKAEIISHELTAQLLRVYPAAHRPVPTKTFTGEHYTLAVGGTRFELIYPGPNHETGNIIVYVPSERLAAMSDLFAPGWAPYLAWGNADHIPGLFKAFDAILALDFDTFAAGHAYRVGNRQDVIDARAFMIDLWNWTMEAKASIPFDTSTAEAGNLWAAQSVWFDRIADQVTPRLIAKWGTKLAAVDSFTWPTVRSVVVSSFTDAPAIPAEVLR
jgi:glyoxylase-like metal-dependent hydrolase (beta-lactamase superfamily II)